MRTTARNRPQRSSSRVGRRMPQRGIAIVTALLVVALAATLAASMTWRELAALRDVENQRLAIETLWVERAAVEWARTTLREESTRSDIAYIGQTWSAPVRDVQLADFLPPDAIAVNGDLANAWISGEVEDAQAKFNLYDLVSRPDAGQPWQVDANGLRAYQQLLTKLSLDSGLADAAARHMARSLADLRGSDSWPMQLVSIRDLTRVPGYDASIVRALTPYVTVLPDYTYVNANTASQIVLAAAIPGLSGDQADALVQHRSTGYFVSTAEIALVLPPSLIATADSMPAGSLASVSSGYFIVHCRIHSARINARIDTLIARYGIGDFTTTKVIWVHRLNS